MITLGEPRQFPLHFQVQPAQPEQAFRVSGGLRRHLDGRVRQGQFQQIGLFFRLVLEITLFLSLPDLEQGGLGDVDMAPLQQLRHLPKEKSQEQSANVGAVHIRVRHDDHPVIAQLADVKLFLAYSTTQGGDQSPHFQG